jgi:two-component system cell cycle sensor histidine kinase/response regulator CckA
MVRIPVFKYFGSIGRASCLALALCLFSPAMAFAVTKSRIFVLHSYSQEYPWTRGQNDGFIRALEADPQVDPLVSTEYLDTKRRSYDEAYAKELERHLRLKYADYQPAAIYVTDDNALLFARDHLSRIFPRVPIFFSGVNDYSVRRSLDPALFTGVFERQELSPNIEWLLRMDKDANDIVFVGDGSNTYQAIERELRTELAPYRLRTTFLGEKSLAHVIARLRDLPGKYVFLTTLGGMTDENGQVLPLSDIMKAIVGTGRIVISMEDDYIIEGVLGGYVTSGEQQGLHAARLLLAFLHGTPVVNLAPILKSPNAFIFDDGVLQQQGIDLPRNIRAQAVLLHQRPSLYVQHRTFILGILITLAALLFFVVNVSLFIMSRKNRQIAKASQKLSESEQSLKLSLSLLKAAFESTADGILVVNENSVIVDYNDRFVNLWRIPEAVLASHDDQKTLAFVLDQLKDPEHFIAKVRELYATPEATSYDLLEFKDGRIFERYSQPQRIDGKPVGRVWSFRDVTERRRAEDALQQSKETLQKIMDGSSAIIFAKDLEGKYIFINSLFEKLFHVTKAEIIGKTDQDIFPKEAADAFRAADVRALHAGGPIEVEEAVPQDGGIHSYLSLKFPLYDNNNIPYAVCGMATDITERKKLEEQSLKYHKLESIGTLAGGIAHDFNNLLQGVFGYISLAKMTAQNPEKRTAALDQAEKALHQSINLTTQLLTFSKGGKPAKKRIDFRPVIEDSTKFTLSGSRSDFRISIPEDLWQVEADAGQVGQVVQNIVLNADQSMPTGGIVRVTASNLNRGDASLPPALPSGDYIMIAIEDTGEGIPEQYLTRIFDPYFTTKEQGSGLGLATSYSIVRNHGGFIDVKTKSGAGSTFSIYLPALASQIKTEAVEKPQPAAKTGRARILVMDDEEVIRNLSRELLGLLGHDIEVVEHGQAALEKYRSAIAEGRPFDVVILDLTIRGGMGGVETVQHLLKIDPNVKAIVSSGYSDDAATANYLTQGFKMSLKKPYNVDALKKALETVLSR